MFRNVNLAAAPPIVSGRAARGETPLPFCADGHVRIRRHDPGRSVRCGVIPKVIWCLVPVSGHIATTTSTTAHLIMVCCHRERGLRAGRRDNVWCLGTCRRTCRTRWENQKIGTRQTFRVMKHPDRQSLMTHILHFKLNRAKVM